jgi:predicted secreted protein
MTRLVHKLQTWNSIKAKQSQPLTRKEIEVQYGSRSVSPTYDAFGSTITVWKNLHSVSRKQQ